MTRPNWQLAMRHQQFKRLVPALLNWFAKNARDLPWRRTRDPYAIWVSEIMLQQTQVKTVIPYWERWRRQLPTIEAVANAGANKIHKLWEGLGYYNRARNLQKAARQIVKMYDGKFPKDFENVLALPGIGRYTAGAICSIAFNQPTPILDGNVIRVLTRVFRIAENPKEKETNARLWKLAEGLVTLAQAPNLLIKGRSGAARRPHQNFLNHSCSYLNQSLMELGALVCLPRNPQCGICPVKKLCVAFQQNRVNELPNLGKRQAAMARRFAAFVFARNGRFLVRQRPAGVVNAQLWEFPNVEILNGDFNPKLEAKNILGIAPLIIKPLCTVKHSITRYRITLETFRITFGRASYASPHSGPAKSETRITRPSEVGIWKTPAQLQRLAFSSAHKRILHQLTNVPKRFGGMRN